MYFYVTLHLSRHSRRDVGRFCTWNDARNFLPLIDAEGLRQFYASIDDCTSVYRFLVTKGAGPLEVISLQDYPNLSIDDVLLKQ